jgi:prenyltransferase beta subunit
MNRNLIPLFCLFALPSIASAQTPTAEEKQTTLQWLYSRQQASGAFAASGAKDASANLGSTSATLRAIKYFGGQIPNKEKCADYVKSCCQSSGGIALTPDGKPDIISTFQGVSALTELGILQAGQEHPLRQEAEKFFRAADPKKFNELRLYAAALEAMQSKDPRAENWIGELLKLQNMEGTFGQGHTRTFDTAGIAVTILRLGGKLEKADAIGKAILEGQRPDGGWGGADPKTSDLESTYRVMRGVQMLKLKPDTAAVRKFVASCRNADGSYATQPGKPGTVSATYYAGIVLHWLERMN